MVDKGAIPEDNVAQADIVYEHEPVEDDSAKDGQASDKTREVVITSGGPEGSEVVYRLYKRRFVGLVALVSADAIIEDFDH